MKIVVCCKIVPDEEQIQVRADRSLALENVPWKISQYDLNALEAAKKLSAEAHGSVVALSVGSTPALEPTKIRKDVLSRGADAYATGGQGNIRITVFPSGRILTERMD